MKAAKSENEIGGHVSPFKMCERLRFSRVGAEIVRVNVREVDDIVDIEVDRDPFLCENDMVVKMRKFDIA